MDPSAKSNSFPYAPPDYFEPVEAVPGVGVRFQKVFFLYFFLFFFSLPYPSSSPSTEPKRKEWVKFGNSVQTLLVVLGTPDQVTTKHENKKIVAYSSVGGGGQGGGGGEERFRPNDYFYNYFRLGLDILIDGERHDVKKFVLHSNIPSHPLFSKYDRCNFQVQVPGGNPGVGLGFFFFFFFFSKKLMIFLLTFSFFFLDTLITFKTDWKDVTRLLGEPIGSFSPFIPFPPSFFTHPLSPLSSFSFCSFFCYLGKPIVLDLSADHMKNPFGPSNFCGYQNMIFEITNELKIASVCLFKE